MSRRHAGATPATVALTAAGVSFTTHAYRHEPTAPSYGLEAAAALHVAAGRLFKTLVVQTVPAGLVVGIVPSDRRLDMKALAAAAGVRHARLADASAAERTTGYVTGGISPFGQKRRLRTLVDRSVRDFETVFVSGGKRGFSIEVASEDLVRVTAAAVMPIAR